MATVNILLDCACSARFSLSDQGGGESYGSLTSFKADKISIRESINSSDHSTAQDRVENNRLNKVAWEITIETKLYDPTLLSRVRGNDLIELTVAAPSGFTCVAQGINTGAEVDYAGPSTLKFGLKAHGTPIVYS